MLSQTAEYALRAAVWLAEHPARARCGSATSRTPSGCRRTTCRRRCTSWRARACCTSVRGKHGGFQPRPPARRHPTARASSQPFEPLGDRKRCVLGRPSAATRHALPGARPVEGGDPRHHVIFQRHHLAADATNAPRRLAIGEATGDSAINAIVARSPNRQIARIAASIGANRYTRCHAPRRLLQFRSIQWSGRARPVPSRRASPPAPNGGLIATWLEPLKPEGRYALRFATSDGRTWSAPGTIRESDRFFVNWADFASLVETREGTWLAHWPEKTAAHALRLSRDGLDLARSRPHLDPPRRLHDDTSATEHGFVAMNAGPSGADLRLARRAQHRRRIGRDVGADPQPRARRDARARDRTRCAHLRMLPGRAGPQRPTDSSRRGAIAAKAKSATSPCPAQENGRWSEPRIVSADSWEHRACPVNGPALVADGRRVDLVWFTGVGGQNRVWLVRSADAARTFGARIRIDEGQTLGRDRRRAGGRRIYCWSRGSRGRAIRPPNGGSGG